jgi:hypothetical protein
VAITRRNYGRGHSYTIDGTRADGVTTILGKSLAKPALINWAGDTTAGYAVDYWDELAALTPSKRLDRLKKGRYEDRDAAAKRGTEVHALAERAIHGEDLADITPEELRGHVESYIAFLDQFNVEQILVEAVVAHRTLMYCGTLDLVADFGGATPGRWLLDIKTGRSGIYGETALQLCAYQHCEMYVDDQGAERELERIGIDRAGAVHVRADGYDLYPVDTSEEVWLAWRHLLWIHRRAGEDQQREWVGESIAPPTRAAA